MDHEARNGTGSNDNEEHTNIYFIVGDRREMATYKANQVTDMELKGLHEIPRLVLILSCLEFQDKIKTRFLISYQDNIKTKTVKIISLVKIIGSQKN
ncbi:hypothetical protein EAG_12446 [Camponotus floridanus]|uniref:Uncharacterized protein n=1 Tax=Camponotus floridanus TaxID=104421 RepID=E2AAU6_CAMFO|nr:hypothetical protein EAG_12446 [Camponotus floridanus]